MTNFDRILHLIGLAATGVVVTGASGGVAIPGWLMIAASVTAFVTGASSNPVVKRTSFFTPKPDARGQIADSEDPK